MPDWRQFVRERLGALGLPPRRQQEIIAELADHLEDRCEALDSEGKGLARAREMAAKEVPDWNQLAGEIRSVEANMNDRTRNLWLPGLATLTVAAGILFLMIRLGLRPLFLNVGPALVPFYVPWVVLLPAMGAAGAYWSRREGGSSLTRLTAGLFPVAALLAAFLLILPVALAVDHQVPLSTKAFALASHVVAWVVIPGVALLLGALPFLRNSKQRLA